MIAPPAELRWIRQPRQARSQKTLDRILDAAEILVGEKGFEDATVSEIVARAGSSVGAFYTRFRDKDGLLYALYERYLEQATATADDALDPDRWEGAGIAEIIASVVPFLVAVYRERRGMMRVFVMRNHVDLDFRSRQERLSHYVSEKLSALLIARRDEMRCADPVLAASFGLAMAFATIESTVLFDETRSRVLDLSDDDLGAELTRAYLAYLGVSNPLQPS